MTILIKREVPVGEIEEAVDAIGGIAEVIMMNRQVTKDAKGFELSPQEIDELRDAYALESSMGGGVHSFRSFNNQFRNDKKLRSSQEILEAAEQRRQQKIQSELSSKERTVQVDPAVLEEIQVNGSRDTNPTTVPPGSPQPSILDYLKEAVTKAGSDEVKKRLW
jgi:hypothetical protein